MASPPAPLLAADACATVPTPAAPSLKSALLIVLGLLVFAVAAILLLRCLLRRGAASSSSSSSSSDAHPPRPAGGAARRPGVLAERDGRQADAGARHGEAEAARMIAAAVVEDEEEDAEVQPVRREHAEPEAGADDDDRERLIASLPLFTMASALAALPKNSPDCAVCLSPFDASADLRLLPACRHAFHAPCIDAWLRTNLVCPICRSAVVSSPPLPVAATATAGDQEPLGTWASTSSRRRSFRVELGSVSNRRSSAAGGGDERRTYSLGGSFDYRVDEEVEAIVSRIVRPMAAARPRPEAAEPGEAALAEAVGSRGWLGEYLDRVAGAAASATSLSGRWSGRRLSIDRRHDDDSTRWDPEAAAVAKSASSLSARWSWRWSQGNRRDEPWDTEAPRRAEVEEEPALVALGRWILGL